MEQEPVNIPTWAKVVRVLGVIAGVLALAAIAYLVSAELAYLLRTHLPDNNGLMHLWGLLDVTEVMRDTYVILSITWGRLDGTEMMRDIYFVLLVIPIRFIKKRKFFEIVYYAFAAIAIFRFCYVMWGWIHRSEVHINLVINTFIISAIFISIIVAHVILVWKWGKFKVEQEPIATAEAT